MTPEINPKWIRMVAKLLDDASDHYDIYSYDCLYYPDNWTAYEREEFRQRVVEWVGDESDQSARHRVCDVMAFLDEYLRGVSDWFAAEARRDESG